MAKFITLIAATAALLTGVLASPALQPRAGCPANTRLCGHEIIDTFQCKPTFPEPLPKSSP